MKKKIIYLILFLFSINFSLAAELLVDKQSSYKAEVIEIISETKEKLGGSEIDSPVQDIRIRILEGKDSGKEIILKNDFIQLKDEQVFFLTETIDGASGHVMYAVSDPYRLNVVYFFSALLFVLIIIFGGKQGIRGVVSLILSLFLIVHVLLPNILVGHDALLISISVASIIIIFGSYITHGFNFTTSSAVFGMIATVIVTGLLAYIATKMSMLTGFVEEETMYLNFDTKGRIDFVGLLLGGMIIGLLGVLYDAAIGQAVAVEELCKAGPHLSRKEIYKRTLRIGREHIGALINTLAIAYVGMSLPLLLLFSLSEASVFEIANREIFATEIIRTLIGSIGLVLAVPITTFIATIMLYGRKFKDSHTGHTHSYSHHH